MRPYKQVVPLLLALSAAQPSAPAMAGQPTERILQDVATWSFLNPAARRLVADGRRALKERNWVKALDANEALLEAAPSSIFTSSPSLPVVKVWSSGSPPPDAEQKPVNGWTWRLETAWLAAYAGDFDGAIRRFSVISTSSMAVRGLAAEGIVFAMARSRRFQEAAAADKAAGTLTPLRGKVWHHAAKGGPEDYRELHRIASLAPSGQGSGSSTLPPPSLSGPIGRIRQTLPAPGRAAPTGRSFAAPVNSSAAVEAALVLTEAWAASQGDPIVRRSQVQLYASMTLQRAGSLFPHHRQRAVSVAAAASQR